MQLQRRDVLSGLKKKGFLEDKEGDKSHWVLVYYDAGGRFSGITTRLSRGTKYREIRAPLLTKMAKQCRLERKEEFHNLVECPMSREAYECLLVSAGHLDPPKRSGSQSGRDATR